MIIPTEIVLTRNGSYAVKGKKNRAYMWPGTALSASTTLFPALKDAVIKNARWVLVWTGQGGGDGEGEGMNPDAQVFRDYCERCDRRECAKK